MIVGYLNYGDAGYHALASAAIGGGSALDLTEEEMKALRDGEMAHQLLQAVCRCRARQALNGVAGACNVYLCTLREEGLEGTLHRCFPGHHEQPWVPKDREELPGQKGDYVRYLAHQFGAGRGLVLRKGAVSEALGILPQTQTKFLTDPQVLEALDELELIVTHKTITRPATAVFAPVSGGYIADD